LAIDLGAIGVSDKLLLTSATANLLGGAVDVTLNGPEPATGGSWDVIVATGNGSIDAGGATFNLPPPAGYWTVTTDSQKVTVVFSKPPTLSVTPATTVTMLVNLGTGQTSSSKTVEMQNIGDSNLDISSITVAGTGFTLLQPTTIPLTLTPGSTDHATVEFDAPTTGTFLGSLIFDSNDPNTPQLVLGLKADVVEALKPAACIESWGRY